MNKRNTEGFVLAYVMIVIAVVSAITMALTTSTLNVLKAQEQSVVRMQDKYEAMGVIENIIANAEDNCIGATADNIGSPETALSKAQDACILAFVKAFNDHKTSNTSGILSNLSNVLVTENFDNYFKIEVISSNSTGEKIKISATYKFDFSSTCFNPGISFYTKSVPNPNYPGEGENGEEQPEYIDETKYKYQIASVKLNCTSYEITSIGGAA